jgi:2-C-methyl-D-erythritol 2,4-cyclodiphosphate synthase
MNFRIGFGFDVHRLTPDRKLVLGGVEIPSDKGLLGHSDADVIIHAICDALLGATGLRDIGFHFPDTDAAWKNADSKNLLSKVVELVHEQNWIIGNIDCTLALEAPKISTYIESMRNELSAILKIDQQNISIKATTTEGLGYTGRGEGAAAWAVALVYQESSNLE